MIDSLTFAAKRPSRMAWPFFVAAVKVEIRVGLTTMFLNQTGWPWYCSPMLPVRGMSFSAVRNLLREPSGFLRPVVHRSKSATTTCFPFSTTFTEAPLTVSFMWFHSPAGLVGFELGASASYNAPQSCLPTLALPCESKIWISKPPCTAFFGSVRKNTPLLQRFDILKSRSNSKLS